MHYQVIPVLSTLRSRTPVITVYLRNESDGRHEGRDPHHQPAPGRLDQHRGQPRPRPAPDRCVGRTECWQEQRPRVLRGERFPASRLGDCDQETSRFVTLLVHYEADTDLLSVLQCCSCTTTPVRSGQSSSTARARSGQTSTK